MGVPGEITITVRAGTTFALYTLERGEVEIVANMAELAAGVLSAPAQQITLTGVLASAYYGAHEPDWRERALLRLRGLLWRWAARAGVRP